MHYKYPKVDEFLLFLDDHFLFSLSQNLMTPCEGQVTTAFHQGGFDFNQVDLNHILNH